MYDIVFYNATNVCCASPSFGLIGRRDDITVGSQLTPLCNRSKFESSIVHFLQLTVAITQYWAARAGLLRLCDNMSISCYEHEGCAKRDNKHRFIPNLLFSDYFIALRVFSAFSFVIILHFHNIIAEQPTRGHCRLALYDDVFIWLRAHHKGIHGSGRSG